MKNLIFWPWFKPNKGTLFVMLLILSVVMLCLYNINSQKFDERRSKYPSQTVGTVEMLQPAAGHDIRCVPTEHPYSARYSVGTKAFLIPLGCAHISELRTGQQIEIWHSKENAQLAIWADHQAPSRWLILGSIAAFVLGILILFKGDWITESFH